jgi:hypothetical protein
LREPPQPAQGAELVADSQDWTVQRGYSLISGDAE